MSKRTSSLCLLFTALLVLGGISLVPSDDSDVDAEDILHGLTKWKDIIDWINGLEFGSVSVQDMKAAVAGFVAKVGDVANHQEEQRGGTVSIGSTVYVTSESGPYRIGYASTYEFSQNGKIYVSSGGELVFGTDFVITGQPATVDLEKGAKVTVLGMTVTMPFALTVVLDGSLSSSLTTTATYYGMSVDGTFVGFLDLEGTITAGPFTFTGVQGKDLEFDFEARAVLDPGSAFQSIRDINKDVFREDNGIEIAIKINNVNIRVDSTLLNVNCHADSSSIRISSALSSPTFDLDYVEVNTIDVQISFLMGVMDAVKLQFESISTTETSEGPRYHAEEIDVNISTMSKTILDMDSFNSEIGMTIDDKPHVVLYKGSLSIVGCTVEMDLEIKDGAIYYTMAGSIVGKLMVENPGNLLGTIEMPIRKDSGLKIGDKVDIRFAADQHAYIELFDVDSNITIYPDNGYEIHEMVSERYIEYEIDPSFGTATAKSTFGEIYVEIETRSYTIWAGDYEIVANATSIVTLPEPAPQEGLVFVGWNDNYRTYAMYYEMPAKDVNLTDIWTGASNSEQITSGIYTISNDRQSIIISGSTMAKIKNMMSEGTVDILNIVLQDGNIKLKENNIQMIDGGMTVIILPHEGQDVPEYEKSIGEGLLYSVEIWDDNGVVDDIGEPISITVQYSKLSETDNCVRAYSIDKHGHLTELESRYHIQERVADIDFETNGLPYTVVKSSLETLKGANAKLILFSMIPVVLVGIGLALITRKHRGA